MGFADRVATTVPPIFLRLALAIVFLWAGLGKILATAEFSGDNAARLANMGVQPLTPANPPATPNTGPDALPAPQPDAPLNDMPEARIPGAQSYAVVRTAQSEAPATPDAPAEAPVEPEAEPEPTTQPLPIPATPQAYSADDFPTPISFRRANGLALTVQKAAFPPPAADGSLPPPFWPEWAADGNWPVVLAWAAVVTELLAAVLVLFGFLTRLSALSLAGVMVSAAWLTQIGPALQSGNTALGFLPAYDAFDIGAWTPLLWQLTIFASAMALVFSGSGALALDRLGGKRHRDDDEE